ncbi:DEDD exonuclease domain-containing protein [Nocardiopsis lambiniae]|uniref:DEDD exonuclease domain-containing protein n=1 Tax=Nocardiopsis lambiniae TaxID=3075539 RepID=A0ABU2M835_9ACTN|nr:DEDD exonuclease domain-containing protein [Nocardiopsis sp. DSM 44743]MDT0328792.1 DEDD exonuclease domain-containing protein [Nocardiopsis sp. DSM 44743]
MVRRSAVPQGVQLDIGDLGTPLGAVSFVVLDLETTGTSATNSRITEVGAVRVRDGEVVEEFTTLVDPGILIPAEITLLTGITQSMVATAPPMEEVLPKVLAFLTAEAGSALVAHNAPFDVGFLKAACERHGVEWPAPPVVDTLRLARAVLPPGQTRNHRLGTLAAFFGSPVTPNHRALDDARATVTVLNGLIDRLTPLGVGSLEELRAVSKPPTRAQRAKRHLAEGLPERPGVYVFTDARGGDLYVGKSNNLRRRVASYFTAAENRQRIREMAGVVEGVTPIVCATELEASVRELRIIAERKPPYNRRSRNPERARWVTLTTETYPRLSVVSTVKDDGAPYIGPYGSASEAEQAKEALLHALPLRQCTHRLTVEGDGTVPCVLAQLGRCGAPCDGTEPLADYLAHAEAARTAMTGDPAVIVDAHTARISELAAHLRYEEAAALRDRLTAFLRGARRAQRLAAIAAVPHLVATRRGPTGWDTSVVRYGRLAAGAVLEPGMEPAAFLRALVATAETVEPAVGPLPSALPAETELILTWLDDPATRLVEIEGEWTCPLRAAEAHTEMTHWAYGRATAQ